MIALKRGLGTQWAGTGAEHGQTRRARGAGADGNGHPGRRIDQASPRHVSNVICKLAYPEADYMSGCTGIELHAYRVGRGIIEIRKRLVRVGNEGSYGRIV